MSAPLMPGRPHCNEQLGVAGDRVLALFVDQVAIPDHHSVHGGHPRRGASR